MLNELEEEEESSWLSDVWKEIQRKNNWEGLIKRALCIPLFLSPDTFHSLLFFGGGRGP